MFFKKELCKERKITSRTLICFRHCVSGTFFVSNLVESGSVKVGGLCVVAVPVGQDHCWMMPRSWRQWTDQNQFHTLTSNAFYSERSSCNGEEEKKTPIAHCGTEWLTESFLSADDAFTPALPHPVIWNGVNSQICHQMWQLYSHMVGPAAVILGFTVTTLWYFKASAPIEMKFSV